MKVGFFYFFGMKLLLLDSNVHLEVVDEVIDS